MDTLFDVLAYFDPIDRLEGLVSTFLNADWRGAYQRRGRMGLLREFIACLTSHNCPTIYIARRSSWRGIDVERLLKRNGVKLWDRGLANRDELYFCVKRRQARWAEYVLLRAGVKCRCEMTDQRNREWAEQYPPGSEPTKKCSPRNRHTPK